MDEDQQLYPTSILSDTDQAKYFLVVLRIIEECNELQMKEQQDFKKRHQDKFKGHKYQVCTLYRCISFLVKLTQLQIEWITMKFRATSRGGVETC